MNHKLALQRGFISNSLYMNVIWTVLLIFAVLTILVFGISVVNNFKVNSIKNEVSDKSEFIKLQVEKNYTDVNQKVSNAINTNINQEMLTLEDFQQALPAIVSSLGNATRVIISAEEIEEIDPEPFPEINYATLDMLKRAKSSGEDPLPEVHLFGREDQYLNFVHILNQANNYFLIISLPTEEVTKGLTISDLDNGNISLVQTANQFSQVVMKEWGVKKLDIDAITSSHRIGNSLFNLSIGYNQPFKIIDLGLLPSIMGLFSSLVLLTALILNKLNSIKLAKLNVKPKEKYVHVPEANNAKNSKAGLITNSNNEENTGIMNQEQKEEFNLDKSIFRAYDIRGIVDKSLTVEAVKLIGQAIGTENLKRGKKQIVVARDGRLSGPKLLDALIEGLVKSGNDVINIGAVPTGVLYFATHHLETGSGVMLTGSHNPANYNGLKIMLNGETLAGQLILNLYQAILLEELEVGDGSVQEMDIADDYIDKIASDIQLDQRLKVVVDAGNGIGGEIGPQLLEEIGCEVIPLHCEIDGSFPNHHPDPSVPANLEDLIATVKAADADIGIAFDGDADRLGVVTKEGEMIYSDRILMLFAKDVLSRDPGASIIFDVKCTGHLPKEIIKYGGQPIIWKTGHSFMKAKLKETKAALAGEMSGHFFFKERWYGFDDGIYAAARLLEILDQEDRPAKEIFDELPNSVSTPELNCKTKEGENYTFIEEFKKVASFPDANITTIDGIRADFTDGWGLVRCSNTTPCLVMRFDADNKEALERIKAEFKKQILEVNGFLQLPF